MNRENKSKEELKKLLILYKGGMLDETDGYVEKIISFFLGAIKAEIEKEIIRRLPAFPPQEKAGKMTEIKLFSANDILEIINKIK